MGFIEVALSLFQQYPALTVVLASVIGTEFLLLLAFLSGQGFLPFWIVIVIGLITLLFVDAAYFYLGKLPFLHKFIWDKIKKKGYTKVFYKLGEMAHKNQFYFLLISKFIYGLRQMVVLYLGYKERKYRNFARNDTPALLIFIITMIPLAWLAGQGVLISFGSIKKVEIGIAVALIFIAVVYEIGKVLLKKFLKSFS